MVSCPQDELSWGYLMDDDVVMPEDVVTSDGSPGLSRRSLLGAAALASGAGLVTFGVPQVVGAAPNVFPEVLDAPVDGLTYISLDAFAFNVASEAGGQYRIFDDLTGTQPINPNDWINAPLPIPLGSVIKQINISYYGEPIVSVLRRALTGARLDIVTPTPLAAGAGLKTKSLAVNAEVTSAASYAVRVYCATGASILGMTVGYIPPAQAFVPYLGPDPRVFDTRPSSGLGPEQEVTVDLSSRLVSTARAAVINLTATQTGGPGFLSVFRDGIVWPGNSSVNFTAPNESVANGVITAITAGKIKVRTGPSSSHIIVDVIGSLL